MKQWHTWERATLALLHDFLKWIKDDAGLVAVEGRVFELVFEVGDVRHIGALF